MKFSSEKREKFMSAIEALPQNLRKAVRDLSQNQLNTAYRTGGWTVTQVVHHLADSHMNSFIRMKLIKTEDHPTLKTYRQDDWAELADGIDPEIESSLQLLEGLHKRWLIFLRNLTESDWERSAHHPEIGEVTLEDLLKVYGKHCEDHLAQISGLRKKQGW